MFQEQRDQQPPDTAVAIQVGVDGFELNVQESGAHEGRQGGVVGVQVLLETRQHITEQVRRRRDIERVARSRPADPVLAASNLARPLVGAAHETLMGVAEQPHRERQTLWIAELAARIGKRLKVIANLLDVGGRWPRSHRRCRSLFSLKREEVDQRCLRAFDLRRQYGFLADERVDEPLERRYHLSGELEPRQRLLAGSEAIDPRGIEHQPWVRWRQRERHKGGDLLTASSCPFVAACNSGGHWF